MGQSFSNELLEAKDMGTVEELLKIQKEVDGKRNHYTSKLCIDALDDECIPILCAGDKTHDFKVFPKPPEHGTPCDRQYSKEHVEQILKKHVSGKYLEELTNLLYQELQDMLKERRDRGEQKDERFKTYLVYGDRSVLRVDFYLYFHRFPESKMYDKVIFYYMQVGVLDIARARQGVLMSELTRAIHDEKVVEEFSSDVRKRAASFVPLYYEAPDTRRRVHEEDNDDRRRRQRNETPPPE